MISPELVAAWTSKFYGYGCWSAPYWFIGLEEGGVDSLEAFRRRLSAWNDRGQPDLLDLHAFHRDIGLAQYASPDTPFQATWRPLIRVLFAAKGMVASKEELRKYQGMELGRSSGETALLELSPLPAKTTKDPWFERDPNST